VSNRSDGGLPMHYPWRVVAFIDILGFGAAVAKSATDERTYKHLLSALTALQEFFLKPSLPVDMEVERALNADTQIMQASDSLIISRSVEEQGGIFYMLSDCAYAIHLLIHHGFLCRGAIKLGQMHHDGSIMFGPGYVEAYKAEEAQVLPIVTFEKELFEVARHFPGLANRGQGDWVEGFLKKNCKQLTDDVFYLDYFTDHDDVFGDGEGAASDHYQGLRAILEQGLKLPQHSNAFLKVMWAASQFNQTAHLYELGRLVIPDPKDALSAEDRERLGI
jgi:hypothetical protein